MTTGWVTAGWVTAQPGEAVRHFDGWNGELQAALEAIESTAFTSELRYNMDEMTQRAERPGFRGVLLADTRGPAAIMFFYPLGDNPGDDAHRFVYLDTLAVRDRGHGTGTRLLCSLIEQCKNEGFSGIELDTEAANARTGQDLPAYYRRFGFEEMVAAAGNITMRLAFTAGAEAEAKAEAGARQHIVPPDPPGTRSHSQ